MGRGQAQTGKLNVVTRFFKRQKDEQPALTGNCPIREHTGDGAYVGRCDFATYEHVCPRHGRLADYPTNDDREVWDPRQRNFGAPKLERFLRERF